MKAKLKVGIAGYGVVGKRRQQFIDLHPQMKTIAVCDRKFNNDGENVGGLRQYQNYKSLLQEDLDVLFVCMPNDMAPIVTMEGMERGLHVFCEKPPGRDLDDIAAVIRCEKKHPGIKLKYGFNHRYHDSVRDAQRIIEQGELGKVVNLRGVYGKSKIINFESDWRTQRKIAGGGILLDQGIHMVDLMRLFAGEFEEIHSVISNNYWGHDVEDNAYVLMKTQKNIVAMLHSSATQWRHRFVLEITLERGAIILSGILSGSKSYGAEKMMEVRASADDAGDPFEQMTRYNRDNSWRDEINEFAECIINDKEVVFGNSTEAMKTMQLVYRIYCADKEWRARFMLSEEIPKDIIGEPHE